MTKKEMDKLRASTIYQDEILYVRYNGKAGNFFRGEIIEAKPRYAKSSNLPYPQPKWVACDYYIEDSDGDSFMVAKDRYGKLFSGFEWVVV